MRVTNGMMVSNLMNNLQNNMERLDEHNRQLSTGKKFDVPSDDPTGAVRSMSLNTTISNNEQYVKNSDEGLLWLQTTDEALSQASKVLERTRELVVYGANDTLSAIDRKGIKDEIVELKENLTEIANSNINGRYLFSGNKTLNEPYPTSDSDYKGDYGEISLEVSYGTELTINQNGSFFKDLLDELSNIADNLDNNPSKLSDENLENLDISTDKMLSIRAENGAKQKRLELTKDRLEKDYIKFKNLLSKNEDVDIAETIMNLKMSENVYRAALSSGSRIIQPSLVDFVK
ncbi:flagellar hook-associated protein 3 FlgL [Orenia metallireducens]|jgi:flagellar hook-associated protein 3 FlgL|uniref:Flagellar hook-associated protein 3 FlgL n=1 Tax=Orenia metallireducens TaxID=1413210 RepID=A0A285GEJ8_9FIRM|nr:flagellar hook-associated protein FlgL [Orenia metallireducens]PRX32577.1 flagellar hook-associated protein 3 FlgL [Orenia metallireducens]SNY20791.1 flagellar hook-associated protein 3 FlgL [Orenia metallireducens]